MVRTAMDIWSTKGIRVFVVRGEDVNCLSLAACRTVDITSQSGAEWRCSMCGTPNSSTNKCSGCNAPRKEMLARGIALIEGLLPASLLLNELDGNFQIDICHGECCRPDHYDEQNVIVSLRDCRILRKWIPILGTIYWEDCEAITLCLEIGCDVELRDVL